MTKIIYAIIGLAVIFGLFALVPKTENKISTSKECTVTNDSAKNDPTTFEKTSAVSATIETDKGNIGLELYQSDAPRTVMNFVTLARNRYYDCLTFHRVEPGFVIQGGDPNGTGTGGSSIWGPKFEDELNPETPSYNIGYKEGVLAMANSGPNTNGSQFFIMLANNETLPKNYSIFGKVTVGMDVVKNIAVGDQIRTIKVQ